MLELVTPKTYTSVAFIFNLGFHNIHTVIRIIF